MSYDSHRHPENYPLAPDARAFSKEQEAQIAALTAEKICTCGDSENMHVDNCEQCFNGDCGCKEFSELKSL